MSLTYTKLAEEMKTKESVISHSDKKNPTDLEQNQIIVS